MAPRPKTTTEELPLPEVKPDWTDFYYNVVDVLNNKAEPIVKPKQLLRVMRVIDAIFLSAEIGHGIVCRI